MDFNALINGNSAFPYLINGTRDSHGTGCAGIIAMEKNNDVCGVGVAYHSSIIGEAYQANVCVVPTVTNSVICRNLARYRDCTN